VPLATTKCWKKISAALILFIDDFATATRQYAKKQMQWFRRDSKFVFIPVQIESDKAKRVSGSAKIITDMYKLYSEKFDTDFSTTSKSVGTDESGSVLPISAQTKLDNERQGEKIKTFMSKCTWLAEGSDDFLAVLPEADECTEKVLGGI